jgi:hypothetical protein
VISPEDVYMTDSTLTRQGMIRALLITTSEYGDSATQKYILVQMPRIEASNSSANSSRDRREELTISKLRARLHQRSSVVPYPPPADVIRELRDEP